MAEYVGALDQGTTSNRFIIFDRNGKIVGIDQKEHEQIFPKPGWVEHNPAEIWQNTQDVIRGALEKPGRERYRRGGRALGLPLSLKTRLHLRKMKVAAISARQVSRPQNRPHLPRWSSVGERGIRPLLQMVGDSARGAAAQSLSPPWTSFAGGRFGSHSGRGGTADGPCPPLCAGRPFRAFAEDSERVGGG